MGEDRLTRTQQEIFSAYSYTSQRLGSPLRRYSAQADSGMFLFMLSEKNLPQKPFGASFG